MLEGKDATGTPCRIFIESEGNEKTGFHPVIVTDSEYPSDWETTPLVATVEGTENGVMITICMGERAPFAESDPLKN